MSACARGLTDCIARGPPGCQLSPGTGTASETGTVAGTALYTSKFQTWRYRSIIALTQVMLVLEAPFPSSLALTMTSSVPGAHPPSNHPLQVLLVPANLLDLVWVTRLNKAVGIPDWVMTFGEEVFIDVVAQMASQPFFIFAAKLCPPNVEASMFALFMGLSNFGKVSAHVMPACLHACMHACMHACS